MTTTFEECGPCPDLRARPWHLPYNWGKSTEKPQSGYSKNAVTHYQNTHHKHIHIITKSPTHPYSTKPTHTHTHIITKSPTNPYSTKPTHTHTHIITKSPTHPYSTKPTHTHTHTLYTFPDFMTTAQDGGKVVSLTHWPSLPPGNTPGTHFC